jgi:hypothetical protein
MLAEVHFGEHQDLFDIMHQSRAQRVMILLYVSVIEQEVSQ